MGEPNVVCNDRCQSNGKRFGIGDVELLELDFVFPHLPQEIFENLNRELLGGAATISETLRAPPKLLVQFDGMKCRELLHVSRAEYPDGFEDLNLGLDALAKAHCHGAIFAVSVFLATDFMSSVSRWAE
jgi:hypothetical protein